MARFVRIDSQIRANRLIRANPELKPILPLQAIRVSGDRISAFQGTKRCKSGQVGGDSPPTC